MKPLLLAMLCALLAPPSRAQDTARDPTALPATLRSAIAASQAASAASGAEDGRDGIRQVVFANGRGHVVQHGRRYAVGQSLDGARIERITEQSVWLREGGQLRREPLYAGVEKRPPAPAPKASAPKKTKEKQP